MPGVVRTNKDRHIGHPSSTPNPFHQTNYATGSPNVFANSEKAVRIGDKTYCTDVAAAGSPNVFVNGIKWHRFDDATCGHSSWIPNKAQTGSTDIFANDPGSKLSGTAVSSNTSTSVTTTTGVHGVSLTGVTVNWAGGGATVASLDGSNNASGSSVAIYPDDDCG
tara:strand:- start:106 stop:600 length:495 start_codon:yes stop_codon:yes gene_type:complete